MDPDRVGSGETREPLLIAHRRRRLIAIAIVAKIIAGIWQIDLTPAEARVARAIAEGGDLKTLAAGLSLSVDTLRGQLKSVFRKTGTRRQNELAALILRSPALRPGEAPPINLL